MNPYNCPGPGDAATHGPCTGHALDPRTDDAWSLEDSADSILAAEVLFPEGGYRPGTVTEAMGEMSDADMGKISLLLGCHEDLAAGEFIRKQVFSYWWAWCLKEAQKRHDADQRKAAEDAVAERYLDRAA